MSLLRHLTANPGWKLVSVLLATLVWLLVHYNITERQPAEQRRTFADLPITVLLRPGDPRTFRLEPGTARLILRGPARVVRDLDPAELQVFVNLAAPGPLPPRADVEVRVPPGLTVVSLTPMQVRVEPLPAAPGT
jgi:hypothetical protein